MLYAIVAVIALILDQAVKYWTTVKVVVNTGTKTLIPGFVHITNVHNFGAAFSILRGHRWLFVALCLVFTAIVVYVLYRRIISTPGARWACIIVLAGAIGNCIDRIICGYVVDMFEFEFMTFPVFNMADMYLTLGAVAFCLCVIFERSPEQKKRKGRAKAVKAGAAPEGELAETAAEAAEKAAEETAAAKPAPRPVFRKRTKVEIPDFPKHEPAPQPVFDPNDPFAEWERHANATQPAPEKKETPAQAPAQPAQKAPAAKPAAPHVEYTQPEKAAPAATPAASAQTPAPAPKPNTEETSYDLDDILAEFRDL